QLPARHQRRAAVEPDAAGAAYRPCGSHRPTPHGPRVPSGSRRHRRATNPAPTHATNRRGEGRRWLPGSWRPPRAASHRPDAHGRIVHSMLVAVTIALGAGRIDVRHIDWSNPLLLSIVNDRCRAWRDWSRRIVAHFSSTRLARERAIRAAHTAAKQSFQPGL